MRILLLAFVALLLLGAPCGGGPGDCAANPYACTVPSDFVALWGPGYPDRPVCVDANREAWVESAVYWGPDVPIPQPFLAPVFPLTWTQNEGHLPQCVEILDTRPPANVPAGYDYACAPNIGSEWDTLITIQPGETWTPGVWMPMCDLKVRLKEGCTEGQPHPWYLRPVIWYAEESRAVMLDFSWPIPPPPHGEPPTTCQADIPGGCDWMAEAICLGEGCSGHDHAMAHATIAECP